MNSPPMHSVIVEHDCHEVERVDFHTTSEVAIMRCANCCAERHVLHAKSSEKTHRNQESEGETKQALNGISESLNQVAKVMELYMRQMLDGTKYATNEALMDDIAKRYNGQIAGEDIPIRWLKPWLATGIRKAQPKVLLLYKQGPVCNRCDRLMFSLGEITVDHIKGDRDRGQLTDLQLLCKNCNEEKGNGPPSALDVSPFKFEAETCVHRVACTEIDTTLPFYDADPRDAICSCFLANNQSSRPYH